MLTSFFLLVLGLSLLLAGGTALVIGSSALAERFGVSPAVVGLTIVAFGTSAPELVVNVMGAIKDQSALAFGNVVGSNIANLGLVLGIAALFRPVEIEGSFVRRELPLLMLATAVVLAMTLDPVLRGSATIIDRSDAVVILLLFCIFLYVSILDVFGPQPGGKLLTEIDSNPVVHAAPLRVNHWILVVVGIAGLFWGGQLTVESGASLASSLGISGVIVGLFVVAVGTSLPELVTSVVAAFRGESDLALGNVVGSNIFNTLFVLPISALVRPVEIPAGGVLDLVVSFMLAAVIVPVFLMGRAILGRATGAAMLLFYISYAAFRSTA
jgi:cation:H+ antiporter